MRKHNLDTNEGRLAALDAAAPIVGRIKDCGLRDRYAVSLDRWLGMMDEELRAGPGPRAQRAVPGPARGGRGVPSGGPGRPDQDGGRAQPGQRQQNGSGPQWAPDPAYDPEDPVIQVEREALKLAVQRPALCGPAFDALGAGCFTAPVHAAVFELIAGCGGAGRAGGGREWAERLRDAAPDDRARGFVTRLAVEPLRVPRSDGEPDARYAEAVLARVEELSVSRRDRADQVAAAAAEPGGRDGRIQPDVRRPGGPGAAPQAAVGAGGRGAVAAVCTSDADRVTSAKVTILDPRNS